MVALFAGEVSSDLKCRHIAKCLKLLNSPKLFQLLFFPVMYSDKPIAIAPPIEMNQ